MNLGILSLLVVIGLVLAGIAGFGVRLACRAARLPTATAEPGSPAAGADRPGGGES
jgi:hypothetical protein